MRLSRFGAASMTSPDDLPGKSRLAVLIVSPLVV